MKNNLLLAFLFMAAPLFGQAIYNSTDFAVVNDSFRLSTANLGLDGFDFAAAGVAQNWDFSTLPYENQEDLIFVDPTQTGYQFTWCLLNGFIINCGSEFEDLTNLAIPELGELNLGPVALSNVVNHAKKTPTTLEYRMLGISIDLGGLPLPVPIDYDNPDTLYQFPIEYTKQDSSTSRLVLDLNPSGVDLVYVADRKRVNTVEAWGSLSTPFGDFPNTLKMRTVLQVNDTVTFQGTVIPTNLTNIIYRWFDPNYGIPVLEASGSLIAGEELITQVRYVDSLRCIEPGALFGFTPLVPFYDAPSESATVNFLNLSSNVDSVAWDFGDGSTSSALNPTHSFACPGLQSVQLVGYNNSCPEFEPDTIVIPLIIIDTTGYSDPVEVEVTICAQDSLFVGGAWQTESGSYADQYVNANGCDSTVITNLTVTTLLEEVFEYQGCQGDGFTLQVGATLFDEGNPSGSAIVQNEVGCDSVIVLVNLEFEPFSTAVEQEDQVLTAVQTNATYQWLNCDENLAPIEGATGMSYETPFFGGNYAVFIDNGTCQDTSDCIFVMPSSNADRLPESAIQLFPNPTSGEMTLTVPVQWTPIQVEVFDSKGQLIWQQSLNKSLSELPSTEWASGVYWLRLRDEEHYFIKKIIKI